jgi:hypothetical protein
MRFCIGEIAVTVVVDDDDFRLPDIDRVAVTNRDFMSTRLGRTTREAGPFVLFARRLQIGDGGAQDVGIVVAECQHAVAFLAEKPAHHSGHMAVVDAERLALVRFLLADRTNAALVREHCSIFLERDSVDVSEALVAMLRIGLPFAAPALAELFLVRLIVGLRGSEQFLPVRRIGLPFATALLADLFFVRLLVAARIGDLFLPIFLIFRVSFAQLFERRHVSRTHKIAQTDGAADEAARKSRPPRRSQRAPRGPDMPVVRLD